MKTIFENLKDNLKKLSFNEVSDNLDEIIAKATEEKLTYSEFLLNVTKIQMAAKQESSIKANMKTAGFPFIKDIDTFDFTFQPSINEMEIRELCSLGFMNNGSSVILIGNPGTGKTHLAISIGIASTNQMYSTYFISIEKLLEKLKFAKLQNRLDSTIKRYCRYKLLIIDHIGYERITEDESVLLMKLVNLRYELKRSIILTTNLNLQQWIEIFDNKIHGDVILDKLIENSKIIVTECNSYRKRNIILPE